MNLDANKIIDNLALKIAELSKRVAILEVENFTLKEDLKKNEGE